MIRQLAGVLMLGFGVWYLAFGTQWIARYRGGDDSNRSVNSTKSLITGVQVFLLGDNCSPSDRSYRIVDAFNSDYRHITSEQKGISLWQSNLRMARPGY